MNHKTWRDESQFCFVQNYTQDYLTDKLEDGAPEKNKKQDSEVIYPQLWAQLFKHMTALLSGCIFIHWVTLDVYISYSTSKPANNFFCKPVLCQARDKVFA